MTRVRFCIDRYLVFLSLSWNSPTYVMLRLHIFRTPLHNWLGCNSISSSTPIVSLHRFEAIQFYELEQFIFAPYVPHLSSTRSDYSISLRVQTRSVYWDPRKFISLSFSKCISSISRSIVDNDPNHILQRKWVKSISRSSSKWISSSSRSVVDNDPNTLLDQRAWISLLFLKMNFFLSYIYPRRCSEDASRSKVWQVNFSFLSKWICVCFLDPSSIESDWNWLLSLQMESLCFPDLSSTMIRTLSSFDGEWTSLLFLELNFSIF